jgi:hypothetical protein
MPAESDSTSSSQRSTGRADNGLTLTDAVIDSLDRFADRVAVRVDGAEYTYRDLDERSNAVANALVERGVEPGDRVAVIAPSSGAATVFPDVLDLALERLRDRFDLDPVVFETAETDPEELREHPELRAADVHEAFRDPDISAVFATIGGDDQVRVLRHLDPEILRSNPTRFFGMSSEGLGESLGPFERRRRRREKTTTPASPATSGPRGSSRSTAGNS